MTANAIISAEWWTVSRAAAARRAGAIFIPYLDSQAEQPPLSWYNLQCALPTKRTETLRSTAPLFTVFSFLGVNIPGLVAAVKMPLSALLLPSRWCRSRLLLRQK